ncbi:MAG: twin-arginine translocation signal domain-containing protein, partial [Deltaproteobacteria bacterium]|nr:twin-arginine translocation signal domain-containing protein [Deltaproteobacteria bacterium]
MAKTRREFLKKAGVAAAAGAGVVLTGNRRLHAQDKVFKW